MGSFHHYNPQKRVPCHAHCTVTRRHGGPRRSGQRRSRGIQSTRLRRRRRTKPASGRHVVPRCTTLYHVFSGRHFSPRRHATSPRRELHFAVAVDRHQVSDSSNNLSGRRTVSRFKFLRTFLRQSELSVT